MAQTAANELLLSQLQLADSTEVSRQVVINNEIDNGELKDWMDGPHMESMVGLQQSVCGLYVLLYRPSDAEVWVRAIPRTDADECRQLEEAGGMEPPGRT